MGMRRPIAVWFLAFFLLFLAVGGLYGGVTMLLDPSGGALQMAEVLPSLPVPDYTLPGLFLLLVMGAVPLLLAYGLLARPAWAWAEPMSRVGRHHWSWSCTVALGLVLAVWLLVQGFLIGFRWPIQYVTAANGFAILLLAMLPVVRRRYVS
jgi:hypothetical protein